MENQKVKESGFYGNYFQSIFQESYRKTKNGFWSAHRLLAKRRVERMGARLNEPTKLKNQGFIEPDPIQKKLSEHLSGKRNWQYQLWSILMFQSWLEKNEINS